MYKSKLTPSKPSQDFARELTGLRFQSNTIALKAIHEKRQPTEAERVAKAELTARINRLIATNPTAWERFQADQRQQAKDNALAAARVEKGIIDEMTGSRASEVMNAMLEHRSRENRREFNAYEQRRWGLLESRVKAAGGAAPSATAGGYREQAAPASRPQSIFSAFGPNTWEFNINPDIYRNRK